MPLQPLPSLNLTSETGKSVFEHLVGLLGRGSARSKATTKRLNLPIFLKDLSSLFTPTVRSCLHSGNET
jgi:hypothetical protein